MLKKLITYTDYFGEQRTEEFCFYLSQADLLKTEIRTSPQGGFKNIVQRMMDAKDYNAMVVLIDELISKSYGKVSDDGRRLMKSPEISREFMETEAYTELMLELLSGDESKITDFIEGILPQQILTEVRAEMAKEKENSASPKVVDGKAVEVVK